MPFELQPSPDDSLARVRGWGDDDYASTQEALRRIAEDPSLRPGMPILMDIRDLEYLATPPEVNAFASPDSMPALYFAHRVAILARRGAQFGVVRAFAARAAQAGAEVEVFVEENLALAWALRRR